MAGSGVNVKMGVSGVAQFKQSMNQAKQAAKTLDAQLALTEKQFKASGDSQEYMAKKTAELQAKLEAQKTVVENAEKALESMAQNGVEKSSTAYQNLYREMLSAKGGMIDTQTQLENVGTAGEDAATGVSDVNTQLGEIGKGISYQNVTDGLDKITSGLGNIIKKAWQAGQELVRATLGAGSWADDLKTQAEKYSTGDWIIDVEELQKMRNAATQIDTDVESIIAARQKLLKGKGGEDEDVWGFLHDNNIATQGRKTEDIFWDVGEAIMKMTDSAKQEETAQKVLGRSWADLKPLFKAGREEYEEAKNSMSILTKEQVDNLGEMDDSYQKMKSEWEAFQRQILETFSGPLKEGMDTISSLFQELNKYLQSDEGKEKLKQIGDTITGLIDKLLNVDPETVVAGLQTVIDSIVGALEWIANPTNQQAVVAGLGAILAGWAGLKLTGTALDILKIINGSKGLLNNGSGGGDTTTATATGAAAGGGVWSKIGTGITTTAGNVTSFIAQNGLANVVPVVGDMFMNQTNAGRALRDGGDVLEGAKQDIAEAAEGIKENAETFGSDWDNNVLTQLGRNAIMFWDGIYKQQEEAAKYAEEKAAEEQAILDQQAQQKSEWSDNWEVGDDWSIEEIMAEVNRRSTSSGNTGATEGSEGNMTNAIRKGISGWKVVMDREAVGQMVADYVNEQLGWIMQNQ